MAEVEDDIVAEGAEIIWVMEANLSYEPGTAEDCREFMDYYDSDQGWCVGDAQTEPEPGVWDDSPFSVGRGFDIIVPRDTMEIVFTTNHGTPTGNENIDGAALLAEVRQWADP